MEMILSLIVIICMVGSFHPAKDRLADEIILNIDTPGIENVRHGHRVKPLSEFVYANIVRQKHDFSCGSAALATVLNYYLGEDLTEEDVINGLFEYGDKEQINRRRAFSLLDMKRFATKLGLNVAGYTAEIDDLRSLGIPGIIPINVFGYNHFVVFRGIYKDHVFVADPFKGNMSYTIEHFKDIWYKNICLLVTNTGREIDMLFLKDEDLRIVEFDMTERAICEIPQRSLVDNEQMLLESTGGYFYKKIH
ncbi:MAG: C39 family peptidase [Deltaproteobacteria bacterium]|nr:C39 family peptidase [Deltaproteobacteria bacterium]